MRLTRAEQERINDSRLKIQSVSRALRQVDPGKIPGYDEIRSCLETADKNLHGALRAASEGQN